MDDEEADGRAGDDGGHRRHVRGRAGRGALGGKLLGAGGGGFLLLFVPPDRQAEVKRRLDTLIHVPFRFEHTGSQIVFYEPEADELFEPA